MKSYLKLYHFTNLLALKCAAIYRANFILDMVVDLIGIAVSIVFYRILYLNIESIGGWRIHELYMLVLVVKFVEDIYQIVFRLNINQIPKKVRSGLLDYDLLMPRNILYTVTVSRMNFKAFAQMIVTVALFFIVVISYRVPVPLDRTLLFLFLLVVSIIIKASFIFLFVQISFYFIRIEALFSVFTSFFSLSTFPDTIFKNAIIRIFFIYLFPVVIIGNYPVKALLNTLHVSSMIHVLIFTIVVVTVSVTSFRILLRRYSSATS